MNIIEYPGAQRDIGTTPLAAALGFFDGVHRGHRKLLALTKKEAEKRGYTPAIFTFRSECKGIKKGGERIYSTEKKLELFSSLGFETVILADFDKISSLCAEEFVEDLLIKKFNVRLAAAGYNFRFGRGALADSKRLTELMSAHGLDSVIMAEEVYRGRTLSTTEIKSALKEGRTDEAAEMLGYPYFRDSSVERGEGMGRKLGFPTVNSSLSSETEVLRSGVYRSAVMIDGRIYNAVTNVGTCPTFAERERHCETFIIDYSGNLYGKKIRTFFLGYLREEKRFEDKNDLILQINVDKNRAIKENGDIKWLEAGLN
jgi:riboflavin kinase/FMN adenylyltransferase